MPSAEKTSAGGKSNIAQRLVWGWESSIIKYVSYVEKDLRIQKQIVRYVVPPNAPKSIDIVCINPAYMVNQSKKCGKGLQKRSERSDLKTIGVQNIG